MRSLWRALALAWLGGSTMLSEDPVRLDRLTEEHRLACSPGASAAQGVKPETPAANERS